MIVADDIEELASVFENASVDAILEIAVERFSPKLVLTSNFGVEGIVVIDKISRIAPDTPVVYLSTGFQFEETDILKQKLQDRYNLNLIEASAKISVEEQNILHGEKLYERNPDLCCRIRKVEPLEDALKGYDGWIAALRRDQSPTRAGIKIFEWNAKHNLVKIHPLAKWTRRDAWDYIIKNNLPYNSLLDEGYKSIGCKPCTRRVDPGQHERSGRWDGVNKVECGIHL